MNENGEKSRLIFGMVVTRCDRFCDRATNKASRLGLQLSWTPPTATPFILHPVIFLGYSVQIKKWYGHRQENR
jgi:hypothetical protein